MSIVYTISSVLVFVLALLIKKSEEKLEFIKTLILTAILNIAYNCFACYMLNLFDIPITLLNLSIINYVIAAVMLIIILIRRKIQKYTISVTNIIVTILLSIVTVAIVYVNFDGLNKIRYVSMDAREHYKTAREFSENTALSNKATENNTAATTFMPIGYTNEGISFKVLRPYIGTVQLYKVYIIYEAFAYLLTGLLFYMLIEKMLTKISSKIITVLFCIVYMLGYPLNAWISGFHYLIFGIAFVEAIIYMFMCDRKVSKTSNIIVLFLLNYGLILSYALFCPFVYLAEFIYVIWKYRKDKKNENNKEKDNKKKHHNKDCIKELRINLILQIIITMVIPGVIGLAYMIIPVAKEVPGYIAHEGWLYKNIWSNFILFVPFTIYAIFKSIKKKEFTFDNLMFVLLALYMLVLFIGTKFEKVSEYYFYKNYFILWTILVYLNIKGLITFLKEEKDKFVPVLFTITYIAIMGMMVYTTNAYVIDKPYDNFKQIMQIFSFNKTMIFAKDSAFLTKDEIDLLTRADKLNINWKDQDSLMVINNPNEGRWIQSMTGYIDLLYEENHDSLVNLMNNKYKTIIVFENKETYKDVKSILKLKDKKIADGNNIGKIYIKEGV